MPVSLATGTWRRSCFALWLPGIYLSEVLQIVFVGAEGGVLDAAILDGGGVDGERERRSFCVDGQTQNCQTQRPNPEP